MTDDLREMRNAVGLAAVVVIGAVLLCSLFGCGPTKEPTQVINWDGTPYHGDKK